MNTDVTEKVVRITGGAMSLDRPLVLGFVAQGTNISFSSDQYKKKEAAETEARAKASGVRYLANDWMFSVTATRSMALALAAGVRVDCIASGILAVPEQLANNEAQRVREKDRREVSHRGSSAAAITSSRRPCF